MKLAFADPIKPDVVYKDHRMIVSRLGKGWRAMMYARASTCRALVRGWACFALAALLLCGPCFAQPENPALSLPFDRELVIGTKEAPPFAMKAADGSWQ